MEALFPAEVPSYLRTDRPIVQCVREVDDGDVLARLGGDARAARAFELAEFYRNTFPGFGDDLKYWEVNIFYGYSQQVCLPPPSLSLSFVRL